MLTGVTDRAPRALAAAPRTASPPSRGAGGAAPAPGAPPPGRGTRLVGLDVARGLAVLGMFTVHVGLGWRLGEWSGEAAALASGRSAALFVVLAGVSMALLAGGARPVRGAAHGVALWRIVVRAAVLLGLGSALTALQTPVSVILAYYAVLFVLAVPLLGERWTVVAAAAAVLAVAGPLVSFHVRGLIEEGGGAAVAAAAVRQRDPLAAATGEGLVELVLTGAYPALTWLPLLLVGLAVGRLDLAAVRVRWALVGAGAALAAGAYTASWALLEVLDARPRLAASLEPGRSLPSGGWGPGLDGVQLPPSEWRWLLVAAPHSGTPFDIAATAGVALAVLGVCLLAGPVLRWVLYPVAAVGSLALTVYVGHILVLYAVGTGAAPSWVAADVALVVTAGALAGASLWRAVVGRGPLEWPLSWMSTQAARRIP